MNTSPFFHLCSLFFTYTRYPSPCFSSQFAADRARRQEIRSLSLSLAPAPSSFHFNVCRFYHRSQRYALYRYETLFSRKYLELARCSSLSAAPEVALSRFKTRRSWPFKVGLLPLPFPRKNRSYATAETHGPISFLFISLPSPFYSPLRLP